MKVGEIYRKEGGNYYYIVIDDYGILRPLILTGDYSYRFYLNSKQEFGIRVNEAENKVGFYKGDVLITDDPSLFVVLNKLGVPDGD